MRILWIKSDFPLPADTGGKIRTLNLLKELARSNEVTFLCYAPPELEEKSINQLRGSGIKVEVIRRPEELKRGLAFVARVALNCFSFRPYIVNKYITRVMTNRVREITEARRVDIVVCDFLEMAWCMEHCGEVPAVLFEHNVETMIWRRYHAVETSFLKRLYFAYEKNRMARFEHAACVRAHKVLTVSQKDGELLRKEFGVRDSVEIPTGVDTIVFRPQGREIRHRLVFCGSMDWMPNIDGFWWFYRSVFPIIKESIPDISFTVVGRRPPEDIVALGNTDSSISITGTVADVRPHVAEAQIYLVPLRVGGGTRIKIYEAMAMKKCIVSTSIGAEGLPLADGVNIMIANGEKEFAEKVNELLRDDNKRNRIAESGYRLVTGHYNWRGAAEKLAAALTSAIEASGSRP